MHIASEGDGLRATLAADAGVDDLTVDCVLGFDQQAAEVAAAGLR